MFSGRARTRARADSAGVAPAALQRAQRGGRQGGGALQGFLQQVQERTTAYNLVLVLPPRHFFFGVLWDSQISFVLEVLKMEILPGTAPQVCLHVFLVLDYQLLKWFPLPVLQVSSELALCTFGLRPLSKESRAVRESLF